MALSGTLDDLGVIDLIQFAHQSHRSGTLVVAGAGQRAELFYRRGRLVHAAMPPFSGIEVLVRIVDWSEGAFEFLPGDDPVETTIEVDVHRAIMMALKLRDERKLEEQQREKQAPSPAAVRQLQAELAARLTELRAATGFLQEAFVVNAAGEILGQAPEEPQPAAAANPLLAAVAQFAGAYPRSGLRRLFVEDEAGSLALAPLEPGNYLVLLADKSASLGAVSMGLMKLAQRLGNGVPPG